jgi:hypothetical protein
MTEQRRSRLSSNVASLPPRKHLRMCIGQVPTNGLRSPVEGWARHDECDTRNHPERAFNSKAATNSLALALGPTRSWMSGIIGHGSTERGLVNASHRIETRSCRLTSAVVAEHELREIDQPKPKQTH